MEQPSKKEERLIAKMIKEAGLEHPSAGFADRVLDSIKPTPSIQTSYKPLITIQGWLVITIAIVITLIMVSKTNVGEFGLFDSFSSSNFISLTNLFNGFRVSNTMLYAICLLGLFWIQIPLLKRWMHKN